MTLKELMTMIEETNKFRKLIKESEYKVQVVVPSTPLGSASTYNQILKLLKSIQFYSEDVINKLLVDNLVQDTNRRFITIIYDKEQDKKYLITFLVE